MPGLFLLPEIMAVQAGEFIDRSTSLGRRYAEVWRGASRRYCSHENVGSGANRVFRAMLFNLMVSKVELWTL